MNNSKRLFPIMFSIIILFIAAVNDDGWPLSSQAETINSGILINKITDGDTIRVYANNQDMRIRLAYIDCPERDQPRGAAATSALRNAVTGKSIWLNIVDVDRYGRKVAEVYSGDRNINLYLVRSGKCFVYRKYAKGKQDYFDAESQAQSERLGVHKDLNAIKPWDWRKAKLK